MSPTAVTEPEHAPLKPVARSSPGMSTSRRPQPFSPADLDEFRALCSRTSTAEEYPHATSIAKNIPIYDARDLLAISQAADAAPDSDAAADKKDALLAELYQCLLTGPGVYVIKGITEPALIDRVNTVFNDIVAAELAEAEAATKAGGQAKGDHFAPAGSNARIWNAFEKLADRDPQSFVEYYANPVLALACASWLGPGYQITSQVNIVRPGGKAQETHRDYHLGFQSEQTACLYPLPTQIATQLLTLQGAIAHTAMPLPSGPTMLLPFSQQYARGFQAYRHAEFRDVFAERRVQLALEKGDAVFFNPALFHAAGENFTSVARGDALDRAANLIQVSAPWSRAMESVDRPKIVKRIWPSLTSFVRTADRGQVNAVVAAAAEGYSFPTNLDRDPPPADGYCPPTMVDVVHRLLAANADETQVAQRLDEMARRRET